MGRMTGKLAVALALAALLASAAAQVGGMVPMLLVLAGLLAYALIARQHATLNADPDEVREARARVAANAVPCDWVRPE